MVDDRTLEKWMALEMRGLAQALVKVPRPLAELLLEPRPAAQTATGPHAFDPAALRAFAERLTPLTRARLRLPVTFYLDRETDASAYVADRVAQDALLEAGLATGAPREGRLWLGESLAREAARRYPTLFQFMML